MQNKTVRHFGLTTDDIFVCNSHSNTESLSLCDFKTKMSGDHFLRSFNVFKKKANQHYENVKTFQRYLPAVVQKIMRTFDSEQRSQFNILSVGSGTGEVDIEIVKIVQRELHKRREWRHISVFNRAIEPDDTSFQRYNEKIAKLVLGVSSSKYEVRKQKFEEYQESVKEPVSFDLIHFMHSLYYVNLQQTIQYCVENELTENGYLVCLVGDNDSVTYKLRMNLFNQANLKATLPVPNSHVEISEELLDIAEQLGLQYDVYFPELFIDLTEAFNPQSKEGNLLLDFITNTEHFRKNADKQGVEETLALLEQLTIKKDGKRVGKQKESIVFLHE